MLNDLASALLHIMTPLPLAFMLGGTALGIVVGAIPGLTGTMLIALTLPLTFYMAPVDAMILLVSMYTGSISGGLITATLWRMPGTPASVMTTFDSYPMAMNGQAGRALGLGIGASFFGGVFAWIVLALLTQPLSEIAIRVWAIRVFQPRAHGPGSYGLSK